MPQQLSRHGHRFFVQRPLSIGLTLALDPSQSKQITSVLRLREGDHVDLFNGDDRTYDAVVRSSTRSAVAVEVVDSENGPAPLSPPVWLALALIKADRFEWAIQKATELGIGRIFPMESEQSVISLRVDRAERRLDRWRRIAVEAAEQSGRCTVPEICEPLEYSDIVAATSECQPILLWEDESTTPLTLIGLDRRPVLLIVGPEGGFTHDEVEVSRAKGIQLASLGPLVLPAETAAIAAIAMLAGRQLSAATSHDRAEHRGRAE